MEDREVNVKFTDITNQKFEFSGIRSLYEFLQAEKDFWAEQAKRVDVEGSAAGKPSKHPYFASVNTFKQVCQTIDSWTPDLANQSQDQLNQNIRAIKQQLEGLKQNWLWSGNPASHKFIDVHLAHGVNAAQGFVDTALQQKLKIDSYESLIGTLTGYEFSFQDSDLLKRRKSEKSSFSRLRKSLSESHKNLIDEVEAFKSDFSNWDQEARQKAERLYNLNKKLGERKRRHQDQTFQNQLHSWDQSIADLEATYEEKLRLEKPATYWKNAADKYRGQGRIWAAILLVVLLAGLAAIATFFLHWLDGKQIGLSLNTLQGVAIFGTFGAVFAYLVRVVSRLAFSSFHLMRDAEEREQLTYLYLSLTKEAEMNKDSRDLVLQALFSRTDSGLLSGDSSPTMPHASDALRVLSRTRSQQ